MSRRLLAAPVAAMVLAAGFALFSLPVCCAPTMAQTVAVAVEGRVVDQQQAALPGVRVALAQGPRHVAATMTDRLGAFTLLEIGPGSYQLRAELAGYVTATRTVTVDSASRIVTVPVLVLAPDPANRAPGVSGRGGPASPSSDADKATAAREMFEAPPVAVAPLLRQPNSQSASVGAFGGGYRPNEPWISPSGRPADYARVAPNRFKRTADEPLSTFGADVDTASFANVRRFLRNGQLPPVEAVRVEEFINYFRFDYAGPRGGHPIGITTEVGEAPWNPRHKLVLIGARAEAMSRREIAGRNIVLLIDVSGSMSPAERLPLVKTAFALFVETLQPSDIVSIVTYAGSSGVALPPTRARDRERIHAAIRGLGAGGSTNGAGGITTAYRLARESFIEGGVNRVILATDGDFNVGVTSRDGLFDLIDREKQSGVFLSVLGVGTDNLQDATMEMLADKGNGHYAYLDSLQEARRVLVREVGSTLETVAKDVKFQVEFNPAEVASWKLIGYENRLLAHEDFNDDRKDGGEVGAGHTVTVLYEIVPVGVERSEADGDDSSGRPEVDPLRYQAAPGRPRGSAPASARRGEWLTVKVRYQAPEGSSSRLITVPVSTTVSVRPTHLPFAAAVAEYGLLLRDGRNAGSRWSDLLKRLEGLSVPAAQRADRDHLVELASLARDLVRVR